MKKIYKRDLYLGIFFLILAIAIWVLIPFQIKVGGYTAMGPRFFPKVITIILAIVSTSLIATSLIKYKKEIKETNDKIDETTKTEKLNLRDETRALLIFCLMLLYAFLMTRIGYILSSLLVVGAIVFILGSRKWYHYVIFASSVFVIYFVFKNFLYVFLP